MESFLKSSKIDQLQNLEQRPQGCMAGRSQISRSLQLSGKATLPSPSDPFLGLLLKDRYLLEAYWTRGQFGRFYLAKDVVGGAADRGDG